MKVFWLRIGSCCEEFSVGDMRGAKAARGSRSGEADHGSRQSVQLLGRSNSLSGPKLREQQVDRAMTAPGQTHMILKTGFGVVTTFVNHEYKYMREWTFAPSYNRKVFVS